MPIISGTFNPVAGSSPPGSGGGPSAAPPPLAPALPVPLVKQLQNELAVVGLSVAGAEAGPTPVFGSATSAQLQVFQARYGLPVTGGLDPATGGVLSLSALVTTEADQAKLRTDLANMVNDDPTSPAYNYWLARYAVMAGDYTTAKTAAGLANGFGDVNTTIGPILDPPPQPQQPEVPYPENFYTYRDDLLEQDQLDQLRSELDSLTVDQYVTYLEQTPATITNLIAAGIDITTTPAVGIDLQGVLGGFISKARSALAALNAWQAGNQHAVNQEFSLATQDYADCQSLAADYFGNIPVPGQTGAQRLQAVLARLEQDQADNASLWYALRWRRILLSLKELEAWDRDRVIGTDGAFSSAPAFVANLFFIPVNDVNPFPFPTSTAQMNQGQRLDFLMLVMSTIWVPLALGELNSQMRQFDTAINGLADFVTAQTSGDVQFLYLCEFIEIPFTRLLSVEALLDRADAEYKSGTTVDQATFPDAPTYQGLLAAQTYEQVLSRIAEDGHQYATYVGQGRDALVASIQDFVSNKKDTTSLAFRSLGNQVTVPTVTPTTNALPGLDRSLGPHQSIVTISSPDTDNRDTNPRLYAIGLLATAKLEQIKAGFNYLGYPPDYVPPWRFSFLLDRARYFAEHAKNAQRDYLNFLSNAERQEFQERSAEQNVEMEQSNVKIETARVDQAQAEVAASQASLVLANQTAQDAKSRFENYLHFDDTMSGLDVASAIFGGLASLAKDVVSAGAEIPEGFVKAQESQAQRDLERENLSLAIGEANLAANVASAKLAVDQAGLLVAGLQRQAALLRHESAVQNLSYLRNQALNSDQWFRLANNIRAISDTYLRYAITLGFLAQQAYEFESDKAIDVIRFDYDASDVGSMLAADFLLRDLDSLEQDLLVSQQTRLQQVRYVLSLARDFPDTLRDLASNGEVQFSTRLEQLERHFPGLLNIRISSVDVQPVALMDPTRVSLELTQLGSGMVRLKVQPGTSPLNNSDLQADPNPHWLKDAEATWPVKVHVSAPEAALFSGLSRQEAVSVSPVGANERAAFEGLPAASNWQIDMSMRENQVVPGTLADVIITFDLEGYYDAELKDVVTNAAAASSPLATTTFISAREALPDAFYSLAQYGTLDWEVSADMLTLTGTPGNLYNVAVLLPLAQDGLELARSYCQYAIAIQVSPGAIAVQTLLPQFTLTPTGLTLNCAFTGPADAAVSWDFGDNTAIAQGATAQHVYARPGRYTVLTRISQNAHLSEYRSAVVVSATQTVSSPLIVAPALSAGPQAGDTVPVTISLPPGLTDVSLECRCGNLRAFSDTGPVVLNLKPGSYVVEFLATRKLSGRFYSKQRYLPTAPVALLRGRISTNRTFDSTTGTNTTVSPNALATQLFGDGTILLSPDDRWTLELPLTENPWFTTVSSSDVSSFDGSEFDDAVISLEYLIVQGS